MLPNLIINRLGDYHSIEIPFVFGNFGNHTLTPADTHLSDQIMDYWANFARTGNPNSAGHFPWPRYTASGDANVVLTTPVHTQRGLYATQCDFWDAHPQPSLKNIQLS